MMLYRNVLNFLRGSVQVEIECACPERVQIGRASCRERV